MNTEPDLIARQQLRRRIRRVLLAFPWACFALAVAAILWAYPK